MSPVSRQIAASFCAAILLVGSGCGPRQPDWYTEIHDLSVVPISAELAPAIASGVKALARQAPVGKGVSDYLKYEELDHRIRPLDSRDAAGDEIYALWQAEPEHLLWIELAETHFHRLPRANDFDRISATPSLSDTNTTIGAYFAARVRYGKSDRGRMYRKAERGMADLDSLGQVWLTLKLATVDYKKGDAVGAVSRLVGQLKFARQAGGLSAEARLWLSISGRLRVLDRLDDALYAATMSVALARHAGNARADIRASIALARIMGSRRESGPAADRLEHLAELARRSNYYWLAQLGLDNAAEIATASGDYQRALALDRRTLALRFAFGDSLNAPRNMASIAHDFRMTGQLDSNFVYLTRAERLVKEFSDKRNLPRMTELLAEYYCFVGNYAVAESLIIAARGLSSSTGTEDYEASLLLRLMPQALEMGRTDLAYEWLARLDELKNSLYSRGLDQNRQADYHMLAAELLSRQGEFRLADEALQEAEHAVSAGGGEGQQWRLASRRGDLALLREDYHAAAEAYTKCLEIAAQGSDPDKIYGSRFRLGHLYLESGRTAEARTLFELVDDGTAFGNRYRTRLFSLLLLGMTHSRDGRHEDALVVLQQGLDQFNQDSPQDLVNRFQLAKGQTLAASGQTREAAAVLHQVLSDAESINNRVSFDDLNIFRSSVGREAAATLIALSYEQPELMSVDDLGRETLTLTGLFPSGLPRPDPGAPWLVMRIGERRSWAWLIDEQGPKLWPLPGQDELREQLKTVLAPMMEPGRPVNRATGTRLAEILLGPAAGVWSAGRTLTIVPDGLLHDVPWSALPLPASFGAPDRSASKKISGALVVDYGQILEFTAGARVDRPPVSPARLSMLAIGCNSTPGLADNDPDLSPLRLAEKEAAAIYRVWPNAEKQLLVGEAADWSGLSSSDLGTYGVVHLASHAQVYQGLPQRSTLRLSSATGAAPVTVTAVSNLKLDAELVYLSSCNAARRLSATGSGVSGFAEAFLTAGARTVIASTHWVDDETSAFMAEKFYAHWLAGKSKAEALRAAQQDLRAARVDWNHPAYWAFFRLIGAGN